jgi:crossover junction endodeoxyribonuclease RuvC
MRCIGFDPGLRKTGWGIIDVSASKITHVANGVCKSDGSDLSKRLLSLYKQLEEVVRKYKPDTAAVEHTFVNKDAAGTLKLGQARAMSLLVPAKAGISVAEYAPNTVKKIVVGVGHAAKEQVEHMVKLQMPGTIINGSDASDALGIAICHAHHVRFEGNLEKAIKKAVSLK